MFQKRTTLPEVGNKYYTSTARGGLSPCIHDGSLKKCAWPGSTLSNCVGWAWGRFSEIMGQPMSNAGAPNAGMWFTNYATQYSRGSTPAVGAIACFSNPGKAGHVLVVEEIYSDGSILTSESGYSSNKPFWNQRRYPPNYMSSPYQFQGFIYNPAVSVSTVTDISSNSDISSAIETLDLSMFTDFSGVDLKTRIGEKKYEELKKLGLIRVIQFGNIDHEFLKTDQINKYIYSNMYTSYNTRNDALGREAQYWDIHGMKPSIGLSDYKLSAMNYTPLLEDIWSNVREKFTYYQMVDEKGYAISNKFHAEGDDAILDSGFVPEEISHDTSRIESNPRNVIEFLHSKGLSYAASVGIAANIKAESNFRTSAVGDKGTSFGICQWHNNRGVAMKEYCNNYGGNWSNNLTGQLEYLWYELSAVSGYGLAALKSVTNTLEGAKQAADIFVRKFERPAKVAEASIKRQNNAEEYWNSIVRYL